MQLYSPSRLRRFQSTKTGGSERNAFKYIVPVTIGTLGAGIGIIGIASISDDTRKVSDLVFLFFIF